jgi:hypothetical protein
MVFEDSSDQLGKEKRTQTGTELKKRGMIMWAKR